MKDAHQKSRSQLTMEPKASMSSLELPRDMSQVSSPQANIGKVSKPSSLTKVSLALSVSAVGLLLPERQPVHAVEFATLEKVQADRPDPQGETFMIPAPVTLATAPEAPPAVEASQLVAASPSTVNRIEPELPAIKHVIEADETFWSLAQRYGVSAEAIANLNNLSLDTTLSLGQSVKIPATFSQPVVAAPKAIEAPQAAPQVASLEPTNSVVVPTMKDLQDQEDEAIATLRARQESLAESIEQVEDEPVTLVFDAENPAQPQSETLISSAITEPATTPAQADSAIVVPVPLPEQPAAQREEPVANRDLLIANNTVSSDSQLPEPPSLRLPSGFPELDHATADTEDSAVAPLAEQPVNEVPQLTTLRPVNPPQAVVATAALNTQTHTVRPGETLYAIARQYGISGRELIAANRLDNPNVIEVNQRLVIPTTGNNTAQNSFVALLPRTTATQGINRDSQTLANAPTLGVAEPRPSRGTERLDVSFDLSAESAVNQLRDDIAKMRQSYQEQQLLVEPPKTQTTIEFTLNASRDSGATILNPEWQADANIEAEPEVVVPDVPQQLAAASQADITNYNSLLRLSIGETVSPELPALSNPEDYIPGEEIFNGYIWPSQGVLTSGYGPRWGRMHRGIDIAAPVGTPIFSAAGGEVIFAGWNSGGYGNLVKVKHSDGSITLYAHNSRILVRRGQQVKQGQQIAAMGSTGRSTGPHLHFEIHRPGQGAQNPVAFLPNR